MNHWARFRRDMLNIARCGALSVGFVLAMTLTDRWPKFWQDVAGLSGLLVIARYGAWPCLRDLVSTAWEETKERL